MRHYVFLSIPLFLTVAKEKDSNFSFFFLAVHLALRIVITVSVAHEITRSLHMHDKLVKSFTVSTPSFVKLIFCSHKLLQKIWLCEISCCL